MIRAVVYVRTDVRYDNEHGEECRRLLYIPIDIVAVPGKGDLVWLPTPRDYGDPQEGKVEWVVHIGGLVLLGVETQNHYMDQEMHDDLLRIGYSTDKPRELTEAMESLLR